VIVHRLKCIKPYFERVVQGVKTFEIRFNDRDFQVGDEIELVEIEEVDEAGVGKEGWVETGRSARLRIDYLLPSDVAFPTPTGIQKGYVVMAIKALRAHLFDEPGEEGESDD